MSKFLVIMHYIDGDIILTSLKQLQYHDTNNSSKKTLQQRPKFLKSIFKHLENQNK